MSERCRVPEFPTNTPSVFPCATSEVNRPIITFADFTLLHLICASNLPTAKAGSSAGSQLGYAHSRQSIPRPQKNNCFWGTIDRVLRPCAQLITVSWKITFYIMSFHTYMVLLSGLLLYQTVWYNIAYQNKLTVRICFLIERTSSQLNLTRTHNLSPNWHKHLEKRKETFSVFWVSQIPLWLSQPR